MLPRLTDGHYDLVFCDGDKTEYAAYLKEALRLLRPGGVVAFDNALWHDRVADPAQRDEETVAIRDLGHAIAAHDDLVSVLLPVGDGLLVAKKDWSPEARAEASGALATRYAGEPASRGATRKRGFPAYRGHRQPARSPQPSGTGPALGDRDDVARLDQDRRAADEPRARGVRGAGREGAPGTRRAPRRRRRRSSPRTTRPAASARS